MAVASVKDLRKRTGFDPGSIDFVILCTQTPDHTLPASANLVQLALDLPKETMCFDFNQGCSGYVYGLSIAAGLIASAQARRGLLITSEAYSKWLHPQDRVNRTLFGDGASATLLEACEESRAGLGPFVHGTDGSGYERLTIPVSGAHAIDKDTTSLPEKVDSGGNLTTDAHLFMDGPEIFRFAVDKVPPLLKNLLSKADITLEQVDHVVLHQANIFMLSYLIKIMKIPPEKATLEMKEVGNTVSTSIPLAIAMAAEGVRIADGQTLALLGFGVGYSWSAGLVIWKQD